MKTFNEAKAGVTGKQYDYLDQRNSEFDDDFQHFLSRANDLKSNIASIIEQNFASVWETPQGIRFLVRFEKVSKCSMYPKHPEKGMLGSTQFFSNQFSFWITNCLILIKDYVHSSQSDFRKLILIKPMIFFL